MKREKDCDWHVTSRPKKESFNHEGTKGTKVSRRASPSCALCALRALVVEFTFGVASNLLIKEESSFSEEKEAKRLLFLRLRQDTRHELDRWLCSDIKVFWFFFSKKNAFLPYV
jgi:hypothetical protein